MKAMSWDNIADYVSVKALQVYYRVFTHAVQIVPLSHHYELHQGLPQAFESW